MAKSKAVSAKPGFTASDVLDRNLGQKSRPWFYVAAFLVPVILTLIAYAAFGVYPFGERSVLALDLNGQYIYYFEALHDAFRGDGSIFYNWSRDLSGEFMGIIGYYLASPFTLIVMILPRTMILESMLIMILCKLGSAGLTFFIYATKSKHVKPMQAVLFSTMYAMMAYAVIQLIDPMWIDGVVFLPLIILGIEYLVDDGRKLNYIIPLAVMFIANFYIGYMTAIFVALYFLYYIFFGTERKFKDAYAYGKTIGLMAVSTVVVLMCSAIMILPVYNALSLGKFEFSGKPDYSFAAQFSPIELVPTLLPNQYYSVNMHGKPEIYCGVLSAVLLPLFYMNKKVRRNRKLGYTLLAMVLLFSMYVRPIDMMWHGGQTPNWLPYRYSFLLSFVFVSMAAEIFANLDGYKLSIKQAGGTFAGIAVLVFIFEAVMESFEYIQTKYKYVAAAPYTTTESRSGETWTELWLGTLVFGLFLAAFYLIMLYFYSNAGNAKKRNILTGAMAAVVFFEAGYNAYDSFKKIDKEVAYSDRDTYYNEMQGGRDVTEAIENYDLMNGGSGMYRAEKTFFRCVNDNLAYGLRGISHSSSVMNTKIINFIETMGYKMQSFTTRYDGNTALADSLLGIKYVVDEPTKSLDGRGISKLLNPAYEYRFTQDYINNDNNPAKLDVYENPYALSVGYMISEDITKLAYLGNDNPFNSQNMFLSTITGNTQFTETEDLITIDGNKEYYTRLPETVIPSDCYTEPYGDAVKYVGNANAADPVINVHFTTVSSNPVYMYLRTTFKEPVNLWISTEKDENGTFINHESFGDGQYFSSGEYGIVYLDSYEPGTEVEVRLTLRDDNNDGEKFAIIQNFFFYELNMDAMAQDLSLLKENQWNITDYTDRYLEGTITAKEGQMMLTTIPSEPGWTVRVDGKKVDTVEVLKAFIGIPLSPGEHTITMKYTPPGFVFGVITLILGIGILVVFYIYDRKHNAVILARIRAKERAKQGLPPEEETNGSKKNVAIIKSKSSVSGNAEDNTSEKTKTDAQINAEKSASKPKNNQNKPNNGNGKKNGGKKKKKKK